MKKFVVGIIALLTFTAPALLIPNYGAAQFDPFKASCDRESSSAVCNERVDSADDNPLTDEDGTLNRVANLIAIISATIAVIIIIIAGITMTLSSGDSTKIQNSRNAIIYAVVGLVVIALARGIVALVVNLV